MYLRVFSCKWSSTHCLIQHKGLSLSFKLSICSSVWGWSAELSLLSEKQPRTTARAQAFFNSWLHHLIDAKGIGTLETGWDWEGNCWRNKLGHGAEAGRCLVEMQFVPGRWMCIVRRLQPCLDLAGDTLVCIHMDTTFTQRTHQPGSLGHALPSACFY